MEFSLIFSSLKILILAAHSVNGRIIRDCPNTYSSYFVADDSNPCVYYWCLSGQLLSNGPMACAPGSGVRPGYEGEDNPCTLQLSECGPGNNGPPPNNNGDHGHWNGNGGGNGGNGGNTGGGSNDPWWTKGGSLKGLWASFRGGSSGGQSNVNGGPSNGANGGSYNGAVNGNGGSSNGVVNENGGSHNGGFNGNGAHYKNGGGSSNGNTNGGLNGNLNGGYSNGNGGSLNGNSGFANGNGASVNGNGASTNGNGQFNRGDTGTISDEAAKSGNGGFYTDGQYNNGGYYYGGPYYGGSHQSGAYYGQYGNNKGGYIWLVPVPAGGSGGNNGNPAPNPTPASTTTPEPTPFTTVKPVPRPTPEPGAGPGNGYKSSNGHGSGNYYAATAYLTEHAYIPGGMEYSGASSLRYCWKACVHSYFCKGFDFDTQQARCYLHGAGTVCQTPQLRVHVNSYRLVDCQQSGTDTTTVTMSTDATDPDVTMFPPKSPIANFTGMHVPGGRLYNTAGPTTPALCLAACASDATCQGVDFDTDGDTCWLHTMTSECSALVSKDTCTHYRCVQCETPVVFPNAHAIGGSQVDGITDPTTCFAACVGECVAVDFDSDSAACYHHGNGTCTALEIKAQCVHFRRPGLCLSGESH